MSNSSFSNKTDGLFSKLGTLRRKKKIKEVEQLEAEGKSAIDGVSFNPAIDSLPEEFILKENEERRMIHPFSQKQYNFQELVRSLINWINDELSEYRIVVCKLDEDLYDGQILGKLVEKLSKQKFDIVEITLNEDLQKYKLREVLNTANRIFNINKQNQKWSVEGIHQRDLIEIIHFLVTLIRFYNVPIRLPSNVVIKVVVVQKLNSKLVSRIVPEQLTDYEIEPNLPTSKKDAFDDIYYNYPEQLHYLKLNIITFLNDQLEKLNIECQLDETNEIDPNQFSDGLLIVFLMGLCEHYFVPLGNLFLTPSDTKLGITEVFNGLKFLDNSSSLKSGDYVNSSSYHKLHNMNIAFQLMEDAGLKVRDKVRPEEIINSDFKSVLRVLFLIFNKYKDLTFK